MDGQAALGEDVLYCMDTLNAQRLNRIRVTWIGEAAPADWPKGAQTHIGRAVVAGQKYAAKVVALRPPAVALQVFLDGADTLWVPESHEGEGEGCYARC